jgi:hypothetical protein
MMGTEIARVGSILVGLIEGMGSMQRSRGRGWGKQGEESRMSG